MSADRRMPAAGFDLEAALRALAPAVAGPALAGAPTATPTPAAPDLASRVRARIEAERPRRATVPWWRAVVARGAPGRVRPIRSSVVLALAVLLLVAAAVAAAIGYGLPGIRILFGPPASPSPTTPSSLPPSGAPGATVGLGTPLTLDEARALVDFEVRLPPDPAIGPPDAVYLAGTRLALVWGPGPALPGTAIAGVGLLLLEVHARVDQVMIDKLLDAGTAIETVTVEGAPGYWIAGEHHQVAYVAPDGSRIEDTVRPAGNTLLWTVDGITYKLEGELERDEAIALATSLR